MDSADEDTNDLAHARLRLAEALREHALVIGEVTLTSGAVAQYYVDAKRAILRPDCFAALAVLVAAQVNEWDGTAVGGMTMGADPVACAALAGGAHAKAFFVRKDAKTHGLQRRIEGPPLGPEDRCVVVEDVVTTGGSTLAAIEALNDAGHEICGVISVLDRLAGGGAVIEREAGAPYVALSTIDDIYPDRPDRPDRLMSADRQEPEARGGGLVIRGARPGDVPLLLEMFRELADYEDLTSELHATEELLLEALFGERPAAEALIAEVGTQAAGYALFYPTFSTFLATQGIWLEDLYVRPEHRKGGVGKALLATVAARTHARGGTRLEWSALDWNDLALGFYKRLGAQPMREWITHRLVGDEIARLGGEAPEAASG